MASFIFSMRVSLLMHPRKRHSGLIDTFSRTVPGDGRQPDDFIEKNTGIVKIASYSLFGT